MKKLLSTLLISATLTSCSYSTGDRVGTIVKFSSKGFVFKTHEGELATLAKGGVGTMITNTFSFSVRDEKIVQDIKNAMAKGGKVSITYEEEFIVFPWEGDTKYFITSVKFLAEQ